MTLKFSTRLYSKRALMAGVRRYGEFASISVRETPKAFFVSISGMGADAKNLPGEFCNYVLLAMREGA